MALNPETPSRPQPRACGRADRTAPIRQEAALADVLAHSAQLAFRPHKSINGWIANKPILVYFSII